MSDNPRPIVDLSATCACGAVRITLRGPIYSMLLCSCEHCQKATGTGHSALAITDPANVTVSGAVKSFDRTADSGAIFTRRFCPQCGTPIYGTSSRKPESIMLPIGLFGGAAEWFHPKRLIFARSHRDWDLVPDDVSQHATYPVRTTAP